MASSSLKLTEPITMGVLGGMGSKGNHPEASSMEPRQAPRMISASSSVVSSNSLSSSSTKALSASRMNANMGVLAGESDAIKNLMKRMSDSCESSAAPPQANKEDEENGVPAGGASAVPGGQVIKSDSPSSSSSSAPAADPSFSEGGNPMVLQMGAPPHPVAEFLFQLTKMLTDNNLEYIEWRNASIFVHDPPGLEKDILPKYFRHSNYSSFQRQMNYFGFRKIAGKGKMAPCSYVNEHAKEDISSLLFIKRKKTGVSSAAAKLMAQQNRISRTMASSGMALNSLGGNQSLMMGGAMGGMVGAGGLPGAAADLSHLQNNFSMMGGMGAAAGAGNMMSSAGAGALNEQASLLREQQNMLAQLQQAHASALTNSASMGVGGSGQGSIPQAAQNKFNSLGMSNVGPNTGVLTNDQGSLYMGATSNNPNDWSNHTTDAATAQLIQQATSSLGAGHLPQGMGGANAGAGDSNNILRVDSAANLRALINQQISMFNTVSADPFSASAMSNLSIPQGTPMPASAAGMVQQQGPCSQQAAANGFPAAMGNPASQAAPGLSYDWNEIFQRSGGVENANAPAGAAMSAADMASLRQLEQQLLHQNSNAGAPGPSAAAPKNTIRQSYNFNGLFGQGGASGGSQGF